MFRVLCVVTVVALLFSLLPVLPSQAAESPACGQSYKVYLPLVGAAEGGNTMAFPTTPILDTFPGPNQGPPPNANWRDIYGVQVYNNHAVGNSMMSYYNTLYGPDCDSYVTLTTLQATVLFQLEVWARYDSAAGTGYFVRASIGGGAPDLFELYRSDGGDAIVLLNSWNITVANGDKYGIRCIGNNISAYYYPAGGPWGLLGTVVDAAYPGAGYCGLNSNNDVSVWPYLFVECNDFGAGINTGAAFPEPGIVDTFVRADEGSPPSTSWRDAAGLSTIGNEAGNTGIYGLAAGGSMWTALVGEDSEVHIVVPTRPDDISYIFLFARTQLFPVLYRAYLLWINRNDGAGDTADLCVIDDSGAGFVILGSVAIVFQDGDSFGLECIGTAIKAYHKPIAGVWTEIISVVDATISGAGYIGAQTIDATARLNDFGGGDYVPAPPAAPTNLTAIATSNTQINLAWTDNSTNEIGFKIERYGGAGSVVFTQIATVGAGSVAYSDTGLDPGVTYTYRVCAYNSGGNSAYTNDASATTMYSTVGYSIITPDGVTYDLMALGLNVNPGIPDGFGLPTVTHRTSNLYRNAGALLKGIDVEPRIVTITSSAIAGSQDALHAVRARLWAALRWNRTLTDPPPPARLRYTANGHTADLYIHYLIDVIGNAGGAVNLQQIGIRVIAYDPLWYATTETTAAVSIPIALAVSGVAGKMSGVWSGMGGGIDQIGFGGRVSAIAYDPASGDVVIGGYFTTAGGVAAPMVARWDSSAGAFVALGPGFNQEVSALAIAPNGDIYAGGVFTALGDATPMLGISVWRGGQWNAVGGGITGGAHWVFALAIDSSGLVYAGGSFTTAGGVAADCIAVWNGAVWAEVGVGGWGISVFTLAIDALDRVYAGGNNGVVGYAGIWDGAAWTAVGVLDNVVRVMAIGLDGILYAGGDFHTADGKTVNHVAQWNGATWEPMGTGTNDIVLSIDVSDDGLVYVGGNFTQAGGVALFDRFAVWNGSAWSPINIDLPGAPYGYSVLSVGSDLYLGFDTAGNAFPGRVTTITTAGDYETFPVFTITGPGTLKHIINETSDEKLIFNSYINPGEAITIDLSPGVKTIESSWAGRPSAMAGLSLPQSDLGIWSLKPDPAAPSGDNDVSLFVTGTTPVAILDDQGPASAAQLSNWGNITGVTYLNTDALGAMYVNIVDDGGGFFHVDLYSDAAKAAGDLVGHTASYNAGGAQAIVADNISGLGGTITIVSATAADANIIVYFATAKIEYYDRYMSADEACQ